MRELWRRVVIGSAIVVYIAGLACAGSLLVGTHRGRRGSPITRRSCPGCARTGRGDGEQAMRADHVIAAPAPDAGAAWRIVRRSQRPRDPAGRSAASHPGRQHLLPRLRRGVPSAHEHPPPRAWPERRRVQDSLRLQPRAAAHVSGARPHVCGPCPQCGAGGPDSPAPDPVRARASAARRNAEHLARGALDPARDPAARGAATHGGAPPTSRCRRAGRGSGRATRCCS